VCTYILTCRPSPHLSPLCSCRSRTQLPMALSAAFLHMPSSTAATISSGSLCCSVLQCVAVYQLPLFVCRLQRLGLSHRVERVAVRRMCCSALHFVAVCCSKSAASFCTSIISFSFLMIKSVDFLINQIPSKANCLVI